MNNPGASDKHLWAEVVFDERTGHEGIEKCTAADDFGFCVPGVGVICRSQ